jgi:hypothetical protein
MTSLLLSCQKTKGHGTKVHIYLSSTLSSYLWFCSVGRTHTIQSLFDVSKLTARLASANGYDGSLMNGLQALPRWNEFMNKPAGAWLGFINAIYWRKYFSFTFFGTPNTSELSSPIYKTLIKQWGTVSTSRYAHGSPTNTAESCAST